MGRATAFLGQKLPTELWHTSSFSLITVRLIPPACGPDPRVARGLRCPSARRRWVRNHARHPGWAQRAAHLQHHTPILAPSCIDGPRAAERFHGLCPPWRIGSQDAATTGGVKGCLRRNGLHLDIQVSLPRIRRPGKWRKRTMKPPDCPMPAPEASSLIPR
jgi:hypothetical protein